MGKISYRESKKNHTLDNLLISSEPYSKSIKDKKTNEVTENDRRK